MSDTNIVEKGRWYPEMPPALPGETDDQYTDRLTGADRTGRVPYDHQRGRQCSIGWHSECFDRAGVWCECPHHTEVKGRRGCRCRPRSGATGHGK